MTAPPDGRWVPGNDWTVLNGQPAVRLPTVSVIVLHHEQPAELARTLRALERQSYPGDRVELVVSDDASARAPEIPAGVRLVAGTGGGGRRSAARNRGVRASCGDLLVFLDADTTPEPDFLRRLVRLPALAPEAVTVGRRRHADLTGCPTDASIEEIGPRHELPSPEWLNAAYAASENLLRAGPRAFRFMISAVLCTSRWFFDEVGGFDESFTAYGGEDWEWAHRAWTGGAVFAHEPGAVAWHDGPDWAARTAGDPGTAAQRKNDETMRLSGLIDVPGHRPRGLWARRSETVVDVDLSIDPDSAFITVDGVLAALPTAVVRVSQPVLGRCHGDPRVRGAAEPAGPEPALSIRVHAGVLIDAVAFPALCHSLREDDIGTCTFTDESGVLLTVETSRHRLRCQRWGPAAGLPNLTLTAESVQRLSLPADVEAYLGGWLSGPANASSTGRSSPRVDDLT